MKKLAYILLFSLLVATSPLVFAQSNQGITEYVYNGSTLDHSYSVTFPSTWQAKTFSDDLQGLAPKTVQEDVLFLIKEFEGQTFDQVIDYYNNENSELVSVQDAFLQAQYLIAKKATYQNTDTDLQYTMTLIRRGSSILVLTEPEENEQYQTTLQSIYNSFQFTDTWRQYINFTDDYYFIYPENLYLIDIPNGVGLIESGEQSDILFEIRQYSGVSLKNTPATALQSDEELISQKDVIFKDREAISATYEKDGKNFGRTFIENAGKVYSISQENQEADYPRSEYFDAYTTEITESFELFEIPNDYSSYKYFPDVEENHPNATSIDNLVPFAIIAGYPDGSFRPDGQINRAELTKMVVASQTNPKASKYNNCFPDVTDQWFAPYICYAKEKGWVVGYDDGTFKPENQINRAEALKILLEVLITDSVPGDQPLNDPSVNDVSESDWYFKYYAFADNNDLLDKQHTTETNNSYLYFPGDMITRKEVAETIYRIKQLNP